MKSKDVFEKLIILITHIIRVCSEEGKKFQITHFEQHGIVHKILNATNLGYRNKVIPMQIKPI